MILRLGVLHYPVTRITGLDDYAVKLDRLVAEGAAGGGALLLMPEYACMEVAAAFGMDGLIDAGLAVVIPDTDEYSAEAVARILDTTIANIEAFRRGEPQNRVHD